MRLLPTKKEHQRPGLGCRRPRCTFQPKQHLPSGHGMTRIFGSPVSLDLFPVLVSCRRVHTCIPCTLQRLINVIFRSCVLGLFAEVYRFLVLFKIIVIIFSILFFFRFTYLIFGCSLSFSLSLSLCFYL